MPATDVQMELSPPSAPLGHKPISRFFIDHHLANLSPSSVVVYLRLLGSTGDQSDNRLCARASIDQLGVGTGLSRSTIKRALKLLVAHGLIEKANPHPEDNPWFPNKFMILPDAPAEPSRVEKTASPKHPKKTKRKNISSLKKLRVFQKSGFVCSYCGISTKQLTIDHIKPLAEGGSNDFENLTAACSKCNKSKGSNALNTSEATYA